MVHRLSGLNDHFCPIAVKVSSYTKKKENPRIKMLYMLYHIVYRLRISTKYKNCKTVVRLYIDSVEYCPDNTETDENRNIIQVKAGESLDW